MKWLGIVLLASIWATCGQAKKHHRKSEVARHRKVEVGSRKSEINQTVDANWIAHYQELEREFHYTVPDDDKIEADGNRFRVPMAVRDHYQDMLRAKGRNDAER